MRQIMRDMLKNKVLSMTVIILLTILCVMTVLFAAGCSESPVDDNMFTEKTLNYYAADWLTKPENATNENFYKEVAITLESSDDIHTFNYYTCNIEGGKEYAEEYAHNIFNSLRAEGCFTGYDVQHHTDRVTFFETEWTSTSIYSTDFSDFYFYNENNGADTYQIGYRTPSFSEKYPEYIFSVITVEYFEKSPNGYNFRITLDNPAHSGGVNVQIGV